MAEKHRFRHQGTVCEISASAIKAALPSGSGMIVHTWVLRVDDVEVPLREFMNHLTGLNLGTHRWAELVAKLDGVSAVNLRLEQT